jgi:hypothetical protein
MKNVLIKKLCQQNLRKKSLEPLNNREGVQRDLESWLFLLNVYGREKEFERMAK